MSISERTLLRWLCGAATPELAERLEKKYQDSPELQVRVSLLRERLRQVESPQRTPAWPMGGRWDRQPLAVWGEETPVELLIGEGAADWLVVLLRETSEGWTFIFPTAPAEEIRLGDLERRGETWVMVVKPEAGRQALALLPPDGPQPAWGEEDVWAGVEAGIRAGVVLTKEI